MFQFGPNQEKWLQALERTENPYQQTSDALCYGGAYCCLGVGALILGLEYSGKRGGFLYRYPHSDATQILAASLEADVYLMLGLHDSLGWFLQTAEIGGIKYQSLVDMNDSGNFTFQQIAEYIRANPSNVFWTSV